MGNKQNYKICHYKINRPINLRIGLDGIVLESGAHNLINYQKDDKMDNPKLNNNKKKVPEKYITAPRHKKQRIYSTTKNLSLDELLNVSILVDAGIKGINKSQHSFNQNEIEYAEKILGLYNDNASFDQAKSLIDELNHKIVLENKKEIRKHKHSEL